MKLRTLSILAALLAAPVAAQEPAELNDLEMAHVAVVASNIDIAYAHLALAFSDNPAVREFAETMIRDHSAVNGQVVALARRLNVQAQDNPFSRQLLAQAADAKDELSSLRGAEFDRAYIENEVAYHEAVNDIVADAFIPNIENADVRQAFEAALGIFRAHQQHAEQLAQRLARGR